MIAIINKILNSFFMQKLILFIKLGIILSSLEALSQTISLPTLTSPFTTVSNSGEACLGTVSYVTSTGYANPVTDNGSLTVPTISTETDNAISGWTKINISGTTATLNKWSNITPIPADFDFYFYGELKTGFKVAYNGLLTFNTLTTTNPPLGNNTSLPSSSLPDQSLCYWDYYQNKGSNDKLYYKVMGSAPNRQLWVKWYAVDMGGTMSPTTKSSDNYFAFVLEETSNNIYFVDMMKNASKALSATLGIQYNSTYYNNYSSTLALSSNNLTFSTNKYYKFTYNESTISYRDTLSYNYSELPASGGYLELPKTTCLTSTLESAYLNILLDLGEDFALGSGISNTSNLTVSYAGYLTSSCTAVFTATESISMNSMDHEVEKLRRINLNPYASSIAYDDVDYIKVSVSRNTGDNSPSSLRVHAWIESDFTYDVLSEDYAVQSMIDLVLASQTNNQVTFNWSTACENTHHYQLQLLRIYNLKEDNTNEYYVYNDALDWDNALSIEVEDANSVTLYMGEGSGYYAWRVRPIGNVYDNGIADSRNWGLWSSHPLVDPVDDDDLWDFTDDEYDEIGYYEETSTSNLPDYLFYFTHSENDKNWIYSRSFTEKNSISQGINYAGGLGQIMQSQHKLMEMDSVLINSQAYDYCGRAAIQTMTAPYNQNHLAYVDEVMQDETQGWYGPEDFDSDERIQFDDDISDVPVWENPLPMTGPINEYYSDANPDLGVPNANNYPFSRILYHQDGRVKKQSLYGDEHRMGLYDNTYIDGGMQRTIRTYYSAVADSELLKVFGNQTPHDTSVYKIIRVDPNEIPTVEYKTIDGKTIATAFINTGDHPLLKDITSKPSILVTKVIQGESYPDPYSVVREQSIAFAEPTMQVELDYFFNIKEFVGECLEYCSSCDYKVDFYIIREETNEYKYQNSIVLGANSCGGDLSLSYSSPSSIMLSDPGVYRFGRRITVNNIKQGQQTYADYHADSIGNAMDSTVLTQFDQFKAYLQGEDANLDSLNAYLDELAGTNPLNTIVFSPMSGGKSSAVSNLSFLKFSDSDDDEMDVRYDEEADEYSIETNCCSVTIPKVTCDEDLCDDLWIPQSGKEEAWEDWEKQLYESHGGYYDFESMLYESETAVNNKLEHLSQFFYDQYGNPVYPYNIKAEATFDISTNNYTDLYDGDEELIWYYESAMPSFTLTISNPDGELINISNLSPAVVGCDLGELHGESLSGGGNVTNMLSVELSDYADELADYLSELLSTYGYSVEAESVGTLQDPKYRITLTNYYSGDIVPSFYHAISISSETYINADVYQQVTNTETGDYPYGDGALNCMLNHMIFEDTDPYSCTDILTALEQFTDDWEALYVSKGVEGYMGTDFLDYFLELCGGKQYSGFSNDEYGTGSTGTSGSNYDKSIDGTSYGYLEYAYKSFKFEYYETGLVLSEQATNCLDMYGVDLSADIKDWLNPEDPGNDSAAWDVDLCGTDAWWSDATKLNGWTGSGIADERDEDLQCKAWEQLHICLETEIETAQNIIKITDCDDPFADYTSCQTALQTLEIDKITAALQMRDKSIQNRINSKVSGIADETTRAIASYSVIEALKEDYLNVSKLQTTDRTALYDNINNLKNLIAGDIDVQDYTGSSMVATGYTKLDGVTKTKAQIFSDLLNDYLEDEDNHMCDVLSPDSSINEAIDEVAERLHIDVTLAKKISSTSSFLSGKCPSTGAKFSVVSKSKVRYQFQSSSAAVEILDFTSDPASYTIPDMEYKVDSLPRTLIPGLRQKSVADCNQDNIDYLLNKLESELADCRQNEIDSMLAHYENTCTLPSAIEDSMLVTYGVDYVHFTLFYYDVSGNLVKVVPPLGVDMVLDTDANGELDSQPSREDDKNHTLISRYKYNSLGQRTYEQTPDGGEKEFWYNSVGQLRFSQNDKQKAEGNYAYLKYDDLARLIESGLSIQEVSDQLFADNVEDEDYPAAGFSERIVSVYDQEVFGLSYLTDGSTLEQHYLQNRISHAYSDADGAAASGDEVYTYYSYDAHGNVEWILQSIPAMNNKYIEYEYDLVSAKVTKVSYNQGMNDQYFYQYEYDSDNRISKLKTSKDGYLWETDAQYAYYAYGPLKRLSIGEDHIQGLDYVYTINGWLKGINHQSLDAANDPGRDGSATSLTAKDVFGMSLGYFDGDFKRKYTNGSTTTYSPFNSDFYTEFGSASEYLNTGIHQHDWNTLQCADNEKYETAVSKAKVNYRPLFNGSITNFTYQQAQVTASTTAPEFDGSPVCFMYNYDELNRLVDANFDYYATDWYRNTITPNTQYNVYESAYEYDENGNITQLNRYDYEGSLFDALNYHYTDGTNQLSRVRDPQADDLLSTDIDDQPSGNYSYDEIGQLAGDHAESISGIEWTSTGHVSKVVFTTTAHVNFTYDAMGHRVSKQSYTASSDLIPDVTYYVSDAKGQVMGIYQNTSETSTDCDLAEMPLFALNRLGMYKPNALLDDDVSYNDEESYTRHVGEKQYEISDYLGNVREVVSDIKEPMSGGGYTAMVKVSNDYFPYGMLLPQRNQDAEDYRYGFQGKEMDNELKGVGNSYDFHARFHDPRLGRFFSMDQLREEDPSNGPYNAMGNDPINMIDPDGKKFVFADGTSETFKGQFYLALQYIRENGQADIVDALENSEEKITVQEVYGIENDKFGGAYTKVGSIYRIDQAAIYWDPSSGVRNVEDNGNETVETNSPATALLHEMDHTNQFINNTEQYIIDIYTETHDQFHNVEEKRAVTGRERQFAQATKEGQREWHLFSPIPFNPYSPIENYEIDFGDDNIRWQIYSTIQAQKERMALENLGQARKIKHEDVDIGSKSEGDLPTFDNE
jgi:RHS repeat-associated protein